MLRFLSYFRVFRFLYNKRNTPAVPKPLPAILTFSPTPPSLSPLYTYPRASRTSSSPPSPLHRIRNPPNPLPSTAGIETETEPKTEIEVYEHTHLVHACLRTPL